MKMSFLTQNWALTEKVGAMLVLVGLMSLGHYSYFHVVVLVDMEAFDPMHQVVVEVFQVVRPSSGHQNLGLVAILSEDLQHYCSTRYSCHSCLSSSFCSSCNNKPKMP
jgi:hypothetical protein